MKRFLAEFWLWILIPGVIVAAGLLWLAMSGDQEASPFVYNIF